jgi:OOP family OmpA-OmpF porin
VSVFVAERGPAADGDDFSELRSLIVGPEQRELEELQARLLDPAEQTREVSRVLPDAISLRGADPELTRALMPSVEEAVTASVRKDPGPLAEALFPVMGPAIRKAIAHALAGMMESLNRAVEHSVSLRAVQWRWTALTTGKPFAEIVLLNTLKYRVEQVFLVHAESGLLLHHVAADPAAGRDADQISAMLTAIQDFVRDSFRAGGGDTLDALRVGDLAVIVEQGPRAFLAGVVRGAPPPDIRERFQIALESVHRQFGSELQEFAGDASRLERARPLLEACLVSEFRSRPPASSRRWAVAAAVVLLVGGAWVLLGWRERRAWDAYVERLRDEPGIAVTSSGRRGGRFFVAGLRDVLAADPAALATEANLAPATFDARWEPYESLAPQFVTTRARDLLRPPANVSLDYRDGTLTASGPAPDRWVLESERLAPALAGIRRFVYTGVAPDHRLKEQLESIAILFVRGQSRFAAGQDTALREAEAVCRGLNDVARARGARASLEIVGHTDADGTELANEPLSEARARAVSDMIGAARLDAIDVSLKGLGSAAPLTAGTSELDKQRNRRVSFRVTLPEAASPGSSRP